MIQTSKIIVEYEMKIAKLGKILRIDRDEVFAVMKKYPVGIDTLYKWACEGLI